MDADPAAGPADEVAASGDFQAAAAARLAPDAAALAAAARLPEQWQRDEAMCRTAAFGQLCGKQPWQPTPLGGSDLQRPLHNYAADGTSDGARASCTKHQVSHINLLPGVMLIWCLDCGICRYFGVMERAESPRHPFEVLYTRCVEAPKRFVFDNGCNVYAYMLNREPAFFQSTRMLVDQMHFRTHTNCAPDYDTGCYCGMALSSSFSYSLFYSFAETLVMLTHLSLRAGYYPDVTNSALAEQKNSFLAKLDGHVSFMSQPVFMYYMRYALYRLNKRQRQAAAKQPSGRQPG